VSPQWPDLVRAAPPAIVLPPGERRAQVRVPGPLALDQVLDLGEGHGVAVVRSADGDRWCVPVIAEAGQLRRSAPGQGTAKRLVGLLAAGGEQSGSNFAWLGLEHAHRSGDRYRCAGSDGSDGSPPVAERAVDVDQTNESVIVDEQVVVKWMTRLPSAQEPGSPAASRIAALAEAGFVDMPAPYGFLVAGSKVSDGQLLACAVAYLPQAEDGWDWATRDLRDWLRGAARLEQSIAPAGRIGAITARMHAGLARLGIGQVSPQQAADLQQQARAELAEAAMLSTGSFAEQLVGWQPRIDACLAGLGSMSSTPSIAIHGDLHVGQILRALEPAGQDRLLVTDFDGNPTLPMHQRWTWQPAAVDVVGMLASLDHVGRIVQYRDADADLASIRAWIAAAQRLFLQSYRDQANDLGILGLLDERLLEPLRLWQEIREIRYAAAHLPHWVYVPELALTDLLDADLLDADPTEEHA